MDASTPNRAKRQGAPTPKAERLPQADASLAPAWIPKTLIAGGGGALGTGWLLGLDIVAVLGGYAAAAGIVIAVTTRVCRWLQP